MHRQDLMCIPRKGARRGSGLTSRGKVLVQLAAPPGFIHRAAAAMAWETPEITGSLVNNDRALRNTTRLFKTLP